MNFKHHILVCCALLGVPAFGAALDPARILEKADRSRGHVSQGLEYEISVRCTEEGQTPTTRKYVVRTFKSDAFARVTEPPERIGDTVLVNGRYVWQFTKTSKKPVPVTLSERTGGGLSSVGDIVASSFGSLYAGQVVGEDTIENQKALRLTLRAKDPLATYATANYWIGKDDGLGLRIAFTGPGDRLLKTVDFTYGNKIKIGKETIPFISRVKLRAEISLSTCEMEYQSPKLVKTDPKEFDRETLEAAHAKGKP
jgi:hypothetical protein